MKINLKFVELHNCLFLAGTNLQLKLDVSKRRELTLVYDRKEKELLVFFNSELAIIPTSNISSMTPFNVSDATDVIPTKLSDVVPCVATTVSNSSRAANSAPAAGVKVQDINPKALKVSAQVSDPTKDIVFSNGPGKTHD